MVSLTACLCFGYLVTVVTGEVGAGLADFKIKNTEGPHEDLNSAVLWTPPLRQILMCRVFCKLFMPRGDESGTFYKFLHELCFRQ